MFLYVAPSDNAKKRSMLKHMSENGDTEPFLQAVSLISIFVKHDSHPHWQPKITRKINAGNYVGLLKSKQIKKMKKHILPETTRNNLLANIFCLFIFFILLFTFFCILFLLYNLFPERVSQQLWPVHPKDTSKNLMHYE